MKSSKAAEKHNPAKTIQFEESLKSFAGRICFSPVLPLLIVFLAAASTLLLHPAIQNALCQIGERLIGRQLTREVWFSRFSSWAKNSLSYSISALLAYAFSFGYAKYKKSTSFSWPLPFIFLASWSLILVCLIPYERERHLLVILTATASYCLLSLAKGKMKSSLEESAPVRQISTRGFFITIFIPVLISFILGLAFIDHGHSWGSDFAEYIAQAQVLATGKDNPNRPQVGYLYGTALLLLPAFKAKGLDLFALKFPMLVCYGAFIAVISIFYQKRFRSGKKLFPTFLLAVSPALISYLNNILSDIPFLLFSSLSVMLFYEMYEEKNSRGKQLLAAIAAGFCVMYAFSCRFQGLVLLLTITCSELLLLLHRIFKHNRLFNYWTKSFRAKSILIHLAFYTAFAAFYALYKILAPASQGRSDLGFLSDFSLKGFVHNIFYYPFFFKEFFSCYGHCPSPICVALYLFSLPLIILGIARKAGEDAICFIFSLGLLVLYILWPGPQDFRFLFPILPFMILFALHGFEELKDPLIKKSYRIFGLFMLCLFFSSLIFDAIENFQGRRDGNYQASSQEARESYAYIRDNTGPDAKILFFKPRVLYLTTGRISAEYDTEKESFNDQLREFDYILSYQGQYHTMPLDKEAYELPQGIALEKAFSNGFFILYRIGKSASNQ